MFEGQNQDMANNVAQSDVNQENAANNNIMQNDVNNGIMQNDINNGELRITDGRFSSQTYSVNGSAGNNNGSTGGNAGSNNVGPGQVNSYYSIPKNDYRYGQGTWQSPNYGQGAGNYKYSSVSLGSIGNARKEKKKKENKGGGYFKKALVCISLGLIFGICAGLGLYAVDAVTDGFKPKTEKTDTAKVQDSDKENVNDVMGKADDLIEKADDIMAETGEAMSGSVKEVDIGKTQTVTTVVSDVSEMVESVMPAVVSINNTYTEKISYFGQTFSSEAQASGSGIIVGENDVELLVVTNYHVVEGSEKLGVVFADGSEVEASVKGMDKDMDLAVLAVPLENIYTSTLNQIAIATMGDSDALKVGEPAIAIGNALGYGQSVTTGCISALNRDMELEDGSTGTFIQTDAAINPGNSGGALLNIKGEVIGINSTKIGGEIIEGMGYAIPISAASPIIADLMLKETKNKVAKDERGFLGISGISVTDELADDYGMPKGLYIMKVYEDTAAEAAGLKKGDIITSFDGEKISSMDELYMLLEYYAKGDTVELEVMKAGINGYKNAKVSVTLGDKSTQ